MAKKKTQEKKRTARRYSKEKQQEEKSRGQVKEEFEGWPLNPSTVDLGEDFLVQIYDDGHSSGLSFLMQLKSTTSLEKITSKTRKVVCYDFKVKDLEHWEDFSPPVVLVVWDITQRRGVWMDIPAVLRQLDSRVKNWRSKGRVTVHLPLSHGTHGVGRERLRQRIARLTLPAIARGRPLKLSPRFEFPNDEEGKAAFESLKRAIEFGETATTPGKYIKALSTSKWWERIFGARIPSAITISPTKFEKTLRMRLVIAGVERSESLPIELRRVKAGLRQVTFSNEHAQEPVKLTLVLDTPEQGPWHLDAKASFRFAAPQVHVALAATRLMLALRAAGRGQLCSEDGLPLGEFDSKSLVGPSVEELLDWERALLKLNFVQGQLGRYGQFDLSDGVSDADRLLLDRLYNICKSGAWESISTWNMTLHSPPKVPDAASPPQPKGPMTMKYDTSESFHLLGVTFPIAKVQAEFLEVDKVLSVLEEAARRQLTQIELKEIRTRFEVLEWGPEPKKKTAKAVKKSVKAVKKKTAKAVKKKTAKAVKKKA